MKDSIWRFYFLIVVLLGVLGFILVFANTFFFFKLIANNTTQEHINGLKSLAVNIDRNFESLKATDHASEHVENLFLHLAETEGVLFVKIIEANTSDIEKSTISGEEGTKNTYLISTQENTTVRNGEFEGRIIKEVILKDDSGYDLWLGFDLKSVKQNAFVIGALMGGIVLMMLVVVGVLIYLAIRRFVIAPFSLLTKVFENLKKDTYEIHVNGSKYIEIDRVFWSLNETVKRLSEIRDREKSLAMEKSEFISIAAHQLRTPLSAIKWTLKMMIDGDVGDVNLDQKEFLKRGYETNERMISLVNDLLNVSRIEQGKFSYNFEDISIQEIIKNVIGNVQHLAREKKLNLVFDEKSVRSAKLRKIKADTEKLSIAIENIIENAIKYTPPKGKIIITLENKGDSVLLKVKDTGVGIPRDQQKNLFGKFFRGSNVIRLQTDGSGLGLFITKNIIERHDGDISVESEEGKGACVIIELPFAGSAVLTSQQKFSDFIKGF